MTNSNRYQPAGKRLGQIVHEFVEIGDRVENTAQVLADVVGAPTTEWAGARDPNGIAVACLYVAEIMLHPANHLTQRELADRTSTSEPTIRSNYRDIPAVFLDEADQSDRDRLDDEVIASLEQLRDIEESGGSVPRYDFAELPSADLLD